MLFGLATLAIGSTAALAAPTTLICDNEIHPDQPSSTIILDEAGRTVSGVEGKGPVAAVFDPGKITFTEVVDSNGDPQSTWNYTLDRLTGNLSMIAGNGTRFPKLATCHPGKAQF
jgi:hypothetical protein